MTTRPHTRNHAASYWEWRVAAAIYYRAAGHFSNAPHESALRDLANGGNMPPLPVSPPTAT